MFDGLGEMFVIGDLVDQTSRPLEMVVPVELGFHTHHVEERPPIHEDDPCDPPADICSERFSDDMDLLLVKCFCHFEEAILVVAFLPKQCPYECAECIDAEAQLEKGVRGWAWSVNCAVCTMARHASS